MSPFESEICKYWRQILQYEELWQKNSLEGGFFYFKWSVLFETVSEKCQL